MAGLVLFTHSVVTDSLRAHGLQLTRPPCPSLPPRACADSHPLSQCVAGVFPCLSRTWGFLAAAAQPCPALLICLSSSVRVQGPGLGRGPLPGDISQTCGLEEPSALHVCDPVGALASLSALPTLPSAHGHPTQRPPPRPRFHAEARPVCHATLPMSHLWPSCLLILCSLFLTSCPSCWPKMHGQAGVFRPCISLLG